MCLRYKNRAVTRFDTEDIPQPREEGIEQEHSEYS